jgi:hypothetical protein
MGETETTGTPGATQEGANAATAASGTPAASTDGGNAAGISAEERAELESLRASKGQALAEKDTLERTKQENEWLRQQVEQASRATTPPTGYDPAATQQARIAQAYQNLQERDPEAAELISATARITQEQFARQQAEQRFYRELGAVPSTDQSEVERIAKAENLWPSIAHDRLEARRYAKEKTELADQRRKLQEDDERRKRGVVSTTASPSPPASTGNEPTREDYAKTARLAGEGSATALKQMREWDKREETEGPIKFRSG